jgi:putative endonuclease
MRQYDVHILASLSRTLHVGATNDLLRRMGEHESGARRGFTRDYHVTALVHFESCSDVRAAIAREKQLERWPRWRKVRLIEAHDVDWRDLSFDWFRDDRRTEP